MITYSPVYSLQRSYFLRGVASVLVPLRRHDLCILLYQFRGCVFLICQKGVASVIVILTEEGVSVTL